jgi:hypothetical protein
MNAASPALRDLQRCLLGALLPRDAGPESPSGSALALLKSTRAPSAARRLQIYRNNAFESLAGALAAVYPVLAQLVGDDYFRQLARRCIASNPLRAGNLHGFGRELPHLLRELPSAAPLPYLPDVAAFEWAWHEVYHESDAALLEPARLAAVAAAEPLALRLPLVPAARLVVSPYPVLRIWQAHQMDVDPVWQLSLDDGGVRLLVLRRALEIEFVPLGAAEAAWLEALAAGRTLADATIAALDREAAFDLAAALARHLALGSFAALNFAEDATS